MKTGRNELCPCESGKKYKHCCLVKQDNAMSSQQKLLMVLFALVMLAGLAAVVGAFRSHEAAGPGQGRVWSEEHQHWH